jgi:16S rRNA (cytosine967-C5)-methyltransferase
MSGSSNATPSQPLARLLEHTADAVQAVRGGKSLTDVLARARPNCDPACRR